MEWVLWFCDLNSAAGTTFMLHLTSSSMLAIIIRHASSSLPKYASGVKRNKTGLICIETVVSRQLQQEIISSVWILKCERKCDLTLTQVHFMNMWPHSTPVPLLLLIQTHLPAWSLPSSLFCTIFRSSIFWCPNGSQQGVYLHSCSSQTTSPRRLNGGKEDKSSHELDEYNGATRCLF